MIVPVELISIPDLWVLRFCLYHSWSFLATSKEDCQVGIRCCIRDWNPSHSLTSQ